MSNFENKEIEIQVQVENAEKLIAFLNKNATFIGRKHQVDKYFSPAHRNFVKAKPVAEWLRLRDSSGKYSINYKYWHYDKDGRSHYCDEYETPIEDIGQMKKIFNSIDIKEIVVVDKIRSAYSFEKYEVAIDKVKGLGDFIEIEYKGKLEKRKPKDITKEMVNFLKQFDCGKISINYVGYPFQLMFPEEVKYEEL